jgi:hypothetical protein
MMSVHYTQCIQEVKRTPTHAPKIVTVQDKIIKMLYFKDSIALKKARRKNSLRSMKTNFVCFTFHIA